MGAPLPFSGDIPLVGADRYQIARRDSTDEEVAGLTLKELYQNL